jgi:hypothetical protein
MDAQLIGPAPRPDVAYRIARERADRATINTRADQLPCAYCQSGLYPQLPPGPCPACGNEPPRNNGRVPEVRSAMRCAICGVPYKNCRHGYQGAYGRT